MIEYTYLAPAEELPAHLPTIAEIQAIPKLPVHPCKQAFRQPTISLLPPHFAIKHKVDLNLREAQNMLFVQKHTDLATPKLYAAFRDTESGINYIIMEYVPGVNIDKVWDKLDPAAKESVVAELRKGFQKLRSLPSPGFLGNIDGKGWMNTFMIEALSKGGEIKTSPPMSGYEWVEKMVEYAQGRYPRHPKLLEFFRQMYHAVLDSSSDPSTAVFTHGDLHDENILIREGDNRPVVIDWEFSGFYPLYHDYIIAMQARMQTGILPTLDIITGIFDAYMSEMLCIDHFRAWSIWEGV